MYSVNATFNSPIEQLQSQLGFLLQLWDTKMYLTVKLVHCNFNTISVPFTSEVYKYAHYLVHCSAAENA